MKAFRKSVVLILTLLLLMGMAFSVPASADTTGDFEISSFGVLTAYKGTGGAVTIPNDVKEIGAGAFQNSKVTTVTIPKGVTMVRRGAFEKSTLTSITLPEGVIAIEDSAFQDCAKLTKVQVPKSVTRIGQNVFSGTPWLEQYPNDMVIVNDILLHYKNKNATAVVLPTGLKRINTGALSGMKRMTELSIPNTVTSIGDEALIGSSALKTLTIPDSVTQIGIEAFASCTNLTNVMLSKNTKVLDYKLFAYCTSLKTIQIPEGVTRVDNYVFENCNSLKEVKLPNSLAYLGGVFSNCSSLKSITFPKSLQHIGTNVYSATNPKDRESFIIYGNSYGKQDSYAANYAKSNGYRFCVIGESLIYLPSGSLLYNERGYRGAITMDTRTYTMAPGDIYDIGVKLAGNAPLKTRKMISSRNGIATVRQLPNGNYRVTGLRTGTTYITYTVYDPESGKEITHASIKFEVKKGVKQHGVACRQITYFN